MIGLSGESTEEYLEAIYSFNEKGQLAKNTDLAKKLSVAPPSVTQMIKKLAEKAGISPDDVFEKDSLDASIVTSVDLEGIED